MPSTHREPSKSKLNVLLNEAPIRLSAASVETGGKSACCDGGNVRDGGNGGGGGGGDGGGDVGGNIGNAGGNSGCERWMTSITLGAITSIVQDTKQQNTPTAISELQAPLDALR